MESPFPLLMSLTLSALADDRYDVSKMDLKPTPATVSSQRHTGLFAQGDALSFGAELKPLDNAPVERAFGQRRHVAFFAIEGELLANSGQRAMFERALGTIPGVDARSLRLSLDIVSLAVSFDPRACQRGADRRILAAQPCAARPHAAIAAHHDAGGAIRNRQCSRMSPG